MAKVGYGKIFVEWDTGDRREIASVDIDTEAKGMRYRVTTRLKRFVFGWEFIRMGLRIMTHGWKEDRFDAQGCGDHCEEPGAASK